MKKILHATVLAAFIVVSITANAKSKLSINTAMPTVMKVIIDGQKFYSQDNNININNLQSGYHDISVYYIKNGRDYTNLFSNGNNRYWKKVVSRQLIIRNNYQYDITINRFGKAFFDQDYLYNNDDWNNDEFENSHYDFDYNDGYNEDYDDWAYFKKNDVKVSGVTSSVKNNYLPAMSNTMFAQVKQTLEQTSFESSKLEFAKQSLDKNSVSTNQVKQLMSMLTMEMDKLDFAKYAYDKTRDKENYFTVANGLTMQLDKDDLLKYIRDKK